MKALAFLLAIYVDFAATAYVIRRKPSLSDLSFNGRQAVVLNDRFKSFNTSTPCTNGETACIGGSFGLCVHGRFSVARCPTTTSCFALPLTDSIGTSVACTTERDMIARIEATGVSVSDIHDPQTSPLLDPRVFSPNSLDDGQSDYPEVGQSPSRTSPNNFINWCLTVNKPLTAGRQLKNGSCSPTPMGDIPAFTNMPSSKFQSPLNNAEIAANTTFVVTLAVAHLETGHFVNASSNFYSAPQEVGAGGDIKGHSHVVIEKLASMTQTTPTDPTKFVFFKGLNLAGDVLSAEVTNGLDEGVYRIASVMTAANHQPVLSPVAQHGSADDMIYISVKAVTTIPAMEGNGTPNNCSSIPT
ncbi:hypothetical protein BXZ70DRAFT_180759 [Cristinia sonorae]|uniref:Carbohydrate-binding module family 19 domain-containing protein n=1 Tax=Cristinia sonorae TaxID=1940300 RepID=A0A8K0UP70_9AGAR|nr:hypothetical protein BXZ70DRAFT_180759 [Cristinia sonorae]